MQVGVGYSELPDSKAAGQQAAYRAVMKAGREDPCGMALLFCTSRHQQSLLREGVLSILGEGIPVYGGGAVGVITNDYYGYEGDQAGIICFWMDGVSFDVKMEGGLGEGERETGYRLGAQLKELDVTPDSPMMLFYDAVAHSEEGVRLLMASWLLEGLKEGLGFLPRLIGAGIQGDHVFTKSPQFTGHAMSREYAFALVFSGEIQMDSTIFRGCRPASPYYTVTKSEGRVLLEINGRRALDFMEDLLGDSIPPQRYRYFLLFGINHGEKWEDYNENNYTTRLCQDIDEERGAIVMLEADMAAGTEFQLMVRSLEAEHIKLKIESMLEHLGEREPVFAMYIDCAGRCAGYSSLEAEDAEILQQAIGERFPLFGIYSGMEIGSVYGQPRGLHWSGVFCLFTREKEKNYGNVKKRESGKETGYTGR